MLALFTKNNEEVLRVTSTSEATFCTKFAHLSEQFQQSGIDIPSEHQKDFEGKKIIYLSDTTNVNQLFIKALHLEISRRTCYSGWHWKVL